MKGLVEPRGRYISRPNNWCPSYWPSRCYLLNLVPKPRASAQEVSGLHEKLEGDFFFLHPVLLLSLLRAGEHACPYMSSRQGIYSLSSRRTMRKERVSVASTSLAFRVCLSIPEAAFWTWQQHKARGFPPARDSHHLSGRTPH